MYAFINSNTVWKLHQTLKKFFNTKKKIF